MGGTAADFLAIADEESFEREAVALLTRQAETHAVFGRFVLGTDDGKGWPSRLEDWPALPVEAFRLHQIWAGPPEAEPDYFETSGTTAARRGRHWFTSLEPYRASVLAGWRRFMPELGEHAWASLIPSVGLRPHSSLARMVQFVAEEVGGGRIVPVFVDENHRVDVAGFGGWLQAHEGRDVLLWATSFGVAAWCEAWRLRGGQPFRLGKRSVLFETGGFKGRAEERSEAEFMELIASVLGLEPAQIWNEYGMTELFSQCYRRRDQPFHRAPPWVRVRLRDPVSGRLCGEGERGLIEVIDLANRESVAAIATRDVGVMRGDGFELLGRVASAEARGCSLPFGAVR